MRKLGKKSTLKRFYQKPSQSINTNLEKRTQEKINTMSNNDTLTMDFVLKNRKLLEHLKKCKVFLSKSMRKNLLKRYSLLNNPIGRKVNHTKAKMAPNRKRGRPRRVPPVLNGIAIKEECNSVSSSPPSLRRNKVILTAETSQQMKNSSLPQTPKAGKQKPAVSGEIVQRPGPIFIRLPPKNSKRTIHKRQIFGKSIDKATLTRRFGKMVFKCHVRVKRLRKSDPIFTRKFKTNRKTVSFMETVEVFGESDVEFESDKSIDTSKNESSKMSRTSTPLRGGKKQTKQNKLKSPKVLSKSQVRLPKTIKESKNKRTENVKQTTKSPRKSVSPKKPNPLKTASPQKSTSPQKEKSPVKAKSPQKKTISPEKKKSPQKSPQKSPISPMKARSPKKKEQQTDAIRRSLIDGKECYVKLNRNSTSLLSLSTSILENGDATESRVENLTIDESEIMETTTAEPSQAQEENEVSSEVMNGSSANDVAKKPDDDDVEMFEEGIAEKEPQSTIDEEADIESSLEPVRLENEPEQDEANNVKDESNVEQDAENNEVNDLTEDAAPMEESNTDKDTDNVKDDINEEKKERDNTSKCVIIDSDDDVELVQDENSKNVNDEEGGEAEKNNEDDVLDDEVLDKDKLNDKDTEETPEDQLNGNDADDNSESASAVKLPTCVEESKDEQESQVSEKRASSPVYGRGKLDKIERNEGRAVNASPRFSGTKTNGTKQKSDASSTMPENSEDLFDLLKSNKLPEKEQSSNRIPSPTPDLSDDEGEHAGGFNKDAQSPIVDLAEESGSSANDSRFSLNTFFKSKNRSGNENPEKSPSNADEINLKNPESNLDSPATQEITIQ